MSVDVKALRAENEALLGNCRHPWCPECECVARTGDEDGCCSACGTDPVWAEPEMVPEIEALKSQNAELVEALEQQCGEYCTWYDTGTPTGYDGSGMAYRLICIARTAIDKARGTK